MDKFPEYRPELQPFVQELKRLFARTDWPDGAGGRVAALQRVGIRINEAHGYEGMVNVCDTIRVSGNSLGAAELEGIWDHIGEWRR